MCSRRLAGIRRTGDRSSTELELPSTVKGGKARYPGDAGTIPCPDRVRRGVASHGELPTALRISTRHRHRHDERCPTQSGAIPLPTTSGGARYRTRSEEHTSELQSQSNLVCRLLLEKKKTKTTNLNTTTTEPTTTSPSHN